MLLGFICCIRKGNFIHLSNDSGEKEKERRQVTTELWTNRGMFHLKYLEFLDSVELRKR
jgi:hypothetical protein